MSFTIILLLTNTLLFLTLTRFMNCFARPSSPLYLRIGYVIAGSFLFLPIETLLPYAPSITLIFLILFLFTLGYSCKLHQHLLFALSYAAAFLIVLPAGHFLRFILTNLFSELPLDTTRSLSFFFCSILHFLILQTVCVIAESRRSRLTKQLFLPLVTVPLASASTYIITAGLSFWKPGPILSILAISVMFMVTVSCLLHFTIIQKFQLLYDARHQDELLIQEAKLKEDYYRELERSQQETRRIHHDLRNQLTGFIDVIGSDSSAALEKLSSLLGELDDSEPKIYTSNEIVNSIIKLKFQAAERSHIHIDFDIMLPKYLEIEYGDMGILFGNLLDNAIEACCRIPEPLRWIRLTSSYSSGGLILIVENSKNEEEDSDLSTIKEKPQEHGIGVKSVQRVVEKYNGAIRFIDEADHFEVSAIMYGI